jgi:RHS repeat-associated protein
MVVMVKDTAFLTRQPDGRLVADRDPSGATEYYLTDALGSTVALTNSSGTKEESYSYDPFGNTTTTAGADNVTQYFRYASGYYSTTGNLYWFRNRYYDPAAQDWTQLDPIDHPSSLAEANRYLYVGADPINAIDPAGLCIICTNPLGIVSTVKRAIHSVKRFLERHSIVRCVLIGIGSLALVGEGIVAAREGAAAIRSGGSLFETLSRLAGGRGTRLGEAGSVGVVGGFTTGGCP